MKIEDLLPNMEKVKKIKLKEAICMRCDFEGSVSRRGHKCPNCGEIKLIPAKYPI